MLTCADRKHHADPAAEGMAVEHGRLTNEAPQNEGDIGDRPSRLFSPSSSPDRPASATVSATGPMSV